MEHRWFYVRGTEEFRECLDALSRGHAVEVEKIVETLASMWEQGGDLSADHVANNVYRYRRGGVDIEYRLFLKKVFLGIDSIGQVVVMVPVAVVGRPNQSAYQLYIERAERGELEPTETDLQEILRACDTHFRNLEEKLPEVNEETKNFLLAIQGFHEQSAHLRSDRLTIYESYSFCEWTQSLDDTQLRTLHAGIVKLIEKISDELNTELKSAQFVRQLITLNEINWREEFWYMLLQDREGTLLFLSRNNEHNMSDPRRLSLRAYPSYIVYGEDLWIAIQKQQAVSLALSPEERQIIEDVLKYQELPVFISGRAGSGKSTMLYYLFSNYWYYLAEFRSKMVFLTYTTTLRESATSQINRIVERIAREHEVAPRQEDKPPVMTTRDFLLLLIGGSEDSYPQDKYLDFNRFRTLVSKNRNLKISEDVCWHVIRTYIKGYFPEKLMTPDDYTAIPSGDRTVSEAEFKTAHQVFLWLRENYPNYWDELDLVRELLKRDNLPEYYIIFCDEAQDFTRIEFELMFRLSFASRYDFGYEIPILPLVLAGDPLQTINPTGFRPEALRASLYDMVVQRVSCRIPKYRREYYLELVHNYRSSEDITRLSNLINLVRASVLAQRPNKYGLPQSAWHQGESTPPGLVSLSRFNDEVAPDSFHVIIHPSLEEDIRLNADKPANDHVGIRRLLNEAERAPNLWTPLQIKGLEKDDVVVYGFGEVLYRLLSQVLPQTSCNLADPEVRKRVSEKVSDSTDLRIKLEYFFSNLYVAVTRGVNHLYIVDTEKGRETLWELFLDKERWQPLLEGISHPWSDRDNFCEIVPLEEISSKPLNIQEEARQALERWDTERDADAGRRAVSWFRRLGNDLKADKIQAEIYEYEREWSKAAEYYERAGVNEKAVACYFWESRWQEVQRLLSKNPSLRQTPLNEWMRKWVLVRQDAENSLAGRTSREQQQWVSTSLGEWLSQTEEVLQSHAQAIDRETTKREVRDAIAIIRGKMSREACLHLYRVLVSQYKTLLNLISPETYLDILRMLKNSYWNERMYSDFIAICDTHGVEDGDKGRYLRAKAELRGFEEGLKYLIQEKAFSEAVNFWKDHGSKWIEDAVELIDELLHRKEAITALEVAMMSSCVDRVVYVLDKSASNKEIRREDLVTLIQRMLSIAKERREVPFAVAVCVTCLKLESRNESFQALHLCIDLGVEAKQLIGTVIDCECDGFLMREIIRSELLARSRAEYMLRDLKLISYILNGLSENEDHIELHANTIREFLYKFSDRVYKAARRNSPSEARDIISEIDYLHDIIKFRIAAVISDPRMAAVIRDLLRAKDILVGQLEQSTPAEERTDDTIELDGEICKYVLRYVKGNKIFPESDERAYYLNLLDTPIIVRLLKQERKMLIVNSGTGDIKSYFRSKRDSKKENLWGHGEIRIEGFRAIITTPSISIEIEAGTSRSSQ